MTSAVALAMRVSFPLLALLVTSLAVVNQACDVRPNECVPNDNTCDGNVANLCVRSGVETHLEIKREDCGDAKVCTMVLDARSPYINDSRTSPACVRKEAPICATEGDFKCSGDTFSTCADLLDGRRAWIEYACPDGCRNGRCD
jgi:hypothetical protein